MDSSGTPSLEFDDLAGKVSAQYRSGDLMISGKEGGSWLTNDHFMMSTPEGHIDLEMHPLRIKITNTSNKGLGYASLGIGASRKHEGVVGPALVLFGNKDQGFAQLDTADGPARLHLEPGMCDGKLLSGGFV
jgi:hypothetical protein